MRKNQVIEILGDLTHFISLLILQANRYDSTVTKKDSKLASAMLRALCVELGLSQDDVTGIIAIADNKLTNTINGIVDMSKTEEEE
tara:strand:- start:759 stop:1016 length:258 start_codon:yes stop_codon:yes gene_type:complete